MDDSKLLYNTVTIVIGGLEVVFVHDKQKRKQHRERLKCMDGCSFLSWGSRIIYLSSSHPRFWMVVEQTLDAGGWGLLPTNSSQSICMGRGGVDC